MTQEALTDDVLEKAIVVLSMHDQQLAANADACIRALSASLTQAREALKPFAQIGGIYAAPVNSFRSDKEAAAVVYTVDTGDVIATIGEFKAAHKALSTTPIQDDEKP